MRFMSLENHFNSASATAAIIKIITLLWSSALLHCPVHWYWQINLRHGELVGNFWRDIKYLEIAGFETIFSRSVYWS